VSHFHKLFYRISEADHARPGLALAAVPDSIVPAVQVAPTLALSELPAEEAYLSPESRLVFLSDPRSHAADRFRLLRMRLKSQGHDGKLKKLLITSPLPGDGKSTVVLNLATALAERGKRSVLVLEADLHHPSIGRRLGLKPWPGLAECLADSSLPRTSVMRRVEPLAWYFMSAGTPRRSPTELLQSSAFAQTMQELARTFDWIVVDSPPVIALSDAVSLQQHVDGALMVVRAGNTPREAVEQAIALLGGKKTLGIVLNCAQVHERSHYGAYYYTSKEPGAERESVVVY